MTDAISKLALATSVSPLDIIALNKGTYPNAKTFQAPLGLVFGQGLVVKDIAATTYVLDPTDLGCLLRFTAATAVSVIVSSAVSGLRTDAIIYLMQYGAGRVTVSAGAGITLRVPLASATPRQQYCWVNVQKTGATEWQLGGDTF